MKYYWKAVNGDEGKFYSSHAVGDLRVEYQIGKWASAPIGGLLVFASEKHANAFNRENKLLIFRCEVLEPVKLPAQRASVFDLMEAIVVWRKTPRHHGQRGWPLGSKSFRLVKLVSEEK
jgi:hypothetical protein